LHQTVVITGATSGLGRLAAFELARRGADLAIIARSAEKAQATARDLLIEAPHAHVDVFPADLTRLGEVERAGERIRERYGAIDVLINNAGLHAFEARVTPDGFPEMVAVNYLAPWVLTRTLLPALHASPAARIVNVASEASRRHGTLTLPDDLTDSSPFSARGSSTIYGKTKLLDIMFTNELARRLDGSAITANCLDPGFNVTGLGRELRAAAVLERMLKVLRIGDPSRGASLIVALATAERYGTVTGRYVTVRGGRELEPAAPAGDPAMCARLWNETERLLD
jgi:NAD(P)-dependent dehydrogenase (short-subunit alcohol dehydrogenase family)